MKEFFNQGDREKALGLMPSPGFDRLTTDQAQAQARVLSDVGSTFGEVRVA